MDRIADKNTFENLNIGNRINVIRPSRCPCAFPSHWHRFIEILFLPEDSPPDSCPPRFQVERETCALLPGDILLIWPGETHSTLSNPGAAVIGFQVSPALFYDLPDFSETLAKIKMLRQLRLSKHKSLRILHLHLQHIFYLQEQKPALYQTRQLLELFHFFLQLGLEDEYLLRETPEGARESISSDSRLRILKVCTYLAEHCTEGLTLSQAALMAGFNPSYFSRLFSRVTASTFLEYQALQRIRLAQGLLMNPALPVTEVAYRSGFRSIATFNRCFRRYTGVSPSIYRKFYDPEASTAVPARNQASAHSCPSGR